jgi:hypothetical protein
MPINKLSWNFQAGTAIGDGGVYRWTPEDKKDGSGICKGPTYRPDGTVIGVDLTPYEIAKLIHDEYWPEGYMKTGPQAKRREPTGCPNGNPNCFIQHDYPDCPF